MAANHLPVHFVIDELPPSFGTHPLTAYRLDNVAATYHPVLQAILGSPLNKAGTVGSVYMNLKLQRWYENLDLRSEYFEGMTQTGFQRIVPDLISTGALRDPNTDHLIWQQVPDIVHLMSTFLPNHRVIHCLSGEEAGDAVNFRDFIDGMSDETSYVFVVGSSGNEGPIHEFINDKIKVSNHGLTPETCMSMICIQLGDKWNIN